MQNAVAFGYCERHEATTVDPAIFNEYIGTYISENKSLPDVLISTDNDKLYWKWQRDGEIPTELLPLTNTTYFMVENERVLFTFKKENNKATMLVVPEDKNEYYFTRKE